MTPNGKVKRPAGQERTDMTKQDECGQQVRSNDLLGEILADIHRDGGHFVATVGVDAAVRAAHCVLIEMRISADRRDGEIERLRKDAERYRYLRDDAGGDAWEGAYKAIGIVQPSAVTDSVIDAAMASDA